MITKIYEYFYGDFDGDDYGYGYFEAEDFFEACEIGDYDTVYIMLKQGFDPSIYHSEAFIIACAMRNDKIVDILLKDPRIDPSTDGNEPLIQAFVSNSQDIMIKIINDNRFDQHRDNDYMMHFFSKAHNLKKSVKIFSTIDKIDMSARENNLLKSAIRNDDVESIRILMSNKKVMDKLTPDIAEKLREKRLLPFYSPRKISR